jgi:hypothetical protein
MHRETDIQLVEMVYGGAGARFLGPIWPCEIPSYTRNSE